MLKQLVSVIGYYRQVRLINTRYRRSYIYKVNLYSLGSVSGKPVWKFETHLSEHLNPDTAIEFAKDFANMHSDSCFYTFKAPAKYARVYELTSALGLDYNAPNYVIIDLLIDNGIEVTTFRGERNRTNHY